MWEKILSHPVVDVLSGMTFSINLRVAKEPMSFILTLPKHLINAKAGTILGPILFLIHLLDISLGLSEGSPDLIGKTYWEKPGSLVTEEAAILFLWLLVARWERQESSLCKCTVQKCSTFCPNPCEMRTVLILTFSRITWTCSWKGSLTNLLRLALLGPHHQIVC